MNFSNRGTTSVRKKNQIRVSEVFDVIDNGDLGVEIIFHNFTRLSLNPDEGKRMIDELKNQIRARPNWPDRSEHWEGYETKTDIYENAPYLEGRVYSFMKEIAILRSRMTRKEREDLNGQN